MPKVRVVITSEDGEVLEDFNVVDPLKGESNPTAAKLAFEVRDIVDATFETDVGGEVS